MKKKQKQKKKGVQYNRALVSVVLIGLMSIPPYASAEESEYLVCIGIGGSYLGHRAVIEALRPKSETKIIYAGNSLSKRELEWALEKVGDHDFSINVMFLSE